MNGSDQQRVGKKTKKGRNMEWEEVAIEEYKTLREESLTSMKMQQSILTFGTATIGLVVTAGFNVWDQSPLPEILFLFLIPAIIYLIILIWLGEVGRMFRVGKFIAGIEEKINARYQDKIKPLSWETWLITSQSDKKTPHHILRFHYVSIFMLFAVTAIGSIAIGNCSAYKTLILPSLVIIDIVEVIILFIIVDLAVRSSMQISYKMQERSLLINKVESTDDHTPLP